MPWGSGPQAKSHEQAETVKAGLMSPKQRYEHKALHF